MLTLTLEEVNDQGTNPHQNEQRCEKYWKEKNMRWPLLAGCGLCSRELERTLVNNVEENLGCVLKFDLGRCTLIHLGEMN